MQLPFNSHVSPSNPLAHAQMNLSSAFSQVPPFLQGELSHGITRRRPKRLFYIQKKWIYNCRQDRCYMIHHKLVDLTKFSTKHFSNHFRLKHGGLSVAGSS